MTEPYAPTEWDRLLNTTERPEDLLEVLKTAPDHVRTRREIQLAMRSRTPDRIAAALEELSTHNKKSVSGIRMMGNIVLTGYDEILAMADPPLPSLDPYDVEDACDAAFARGMALGEHNDFEAANARFLLAHKLATALDMHYRVQHVEMEWARVLTNAGRPDPARILAGMTMQPLSPRRQLWGLRNLAEAYIALGDYKSAQRQQERPLDQRTDLGHFIAALQGDYPEKREECPQGGFTAVTEALWALRLSKPLALPTKSSSSPQGDYQYLFQAWAQLRTRSMAPQAHHLLSNLVVRTPDQRAHRAAALIYANAQSAQQDDIDVLVTEFNAALNAMSIRSPFLALLRAIQPDAYVLLGMLPGIHPEVADGLSELAILTGMCLAYRYEHYKLPGRAQGSLILVLAEYRGLTGHDARPHPMTHQRIREAVGGLGLQGYVNIGGVLRALRAFRSNARPGRKTAWANAFSHALEWLDSQALQSDISAEN